MKKIFVNNIEISNDSKIVFIAGPCIIETEEILNKVASTLITLSKKYNFNFIFKVSFDKSNRTSLNHYRGPGIEKAKKIFSNLKKKFNLSILTDIHLPHQAKEIAEVVDIIQVPAFLSRQTDIIVEAAKTKKIINIKKGQFMSPWDIEKVIKKIEDSGNNKILVTERGSSFGYNNLVVDIRSLVIMKQFGYPVILDCVHSLQLGTSGGSSSFGQKKFILPLAKAGTACGIAGIFLETHPDPSKALCDGLTSLPLNQLEKFVNEILKIDKTVKKY